MRSILFLTARVLIRWITSAAIASGTASPRKNSVHLRGFQGKKHVHKCGYDRHIKNVAKQHRPLGKSSPHPGRDYAFTFPGGKTRSGQDGQDLKACLIIRQAGDAEHQGK